MKVHNNFFKAFGVLLVGALLVAALPTGAVKAQTTPVINHGTFGGAPYAREDIAAVTEFKDEALAIEAGGYVSDTEFHTLEGTIISFDGGSTYVTDRGGCIYIQSVISGLQAGDIVEIDNNSFEDTGAGHVSFWDQDPYWIEIGDYTHTDTDTILNWLIYSEKVNDTEYRLVIGSGVYELAENFDDLTSFIGYSLKMTRDVKVYRGETLLNPTTSSRGYIASTNEDTSTWSSPIVSDSLDTGDLTYVGVQETFVDDDWAGSSNGDVVGGHIYGQDAFASIQQAINATANGGTINVAAGTYDETLNIDTRSNLTLVGESKETTIIQPSTLLGWNVGGYAETRKTVLRVVNSTGITLSGFTVDLDLVKGNNVFAALVWDSTGTFDSNKFMNNQIPDATGGYYELGAYLRASGYTHTARAPFTISNNVFEDMGRVAINTHDYIDMNITGNKFYKTEDDFGYGIELGSESVGTISGNEFYGFDTPAASDGSTSAAIYVENSFTNDVTTGFTKNVTISNNDIHDNQLGFAVGNEWDGYAGNVDIVVSLTGNQIYDNLDGAVSLADEDKELGSSVTLTGSNNVLTNNGQYGYLISTNGDGSITTTLTDETISGHISGITILDTGTTSTSDYSVSVSSSDLSGNSTSGIDNQVTTLSVNASPNWWGSALGPQGLVTGDVTYSPWCGDAACSFLVYDTPQTDGFYLEDGKVALSGTINFTGGIPASEPGVTYLIKQGTTIQNDSPCFIVTADHVRIEGEYPGEEFCVPTVDSAGIEVAAGVSDLLIKNLDISGASTTGPAINFAGDVNGVQIVNNKMHDFTASAIVFGGEVLTEHVIQGNMFMNVGSPAIVSPTTALDASYNSWGENAAPTITNVTTSPFTHADVTVNTTYDFFSGSQILAGETITYSVTANLTEISGAEFTLTYPTDLLTLSGTTDGTVFIGNGPGGLLLDTTIAGTIDFSGTIPLGGTPVTGTNLELFTATFTVVDPITAATLGTMELVEIPQGFSMTPVGTSYTNHVYPAFFTDAELTAIGDLPTIDAVGMEGYYLVGETREFVVSADNPASGGTFSNVLFRFEVSANAGEITLFQYDDAGTWTDMPLDCTTTSGICVGYFGPSVGFPITPDYTADTTFRAEFAAEGDYPVEVTLVDLNDAEEVLATYNNTAVVYTVPTITSTDIAGPYQAEFAQAFDLTVTVDPDMVGEVAFELLFDFSAGTVVTYGGTDYTCTIAGCPLIPVTLAGGENTLPFTVTFPAGYDGSINVTLLDTAWDPDRTLAIQAFDVLVYGNFAVDGKVTMQGRTYRGDVPMTFTGLDLLGYGPYLGTSLDQLGQNIFFTDVAGGYYVVTTDQARYLNVPGAMLVVSNTMSLPELYLYGGNANTDYIVDLSDATLVGSAYGTGDITSRGDVNFDNQVNIQDLALVGGNYLLTDAVYDDWMIPYGIQGQVLTDVSGNVTGSLTGTYNITIDGQVTDYVNNQATFSGTVTGDIIGTVTATINENGTGTMYGTLTEDITDEVYQILGIFPKSGVGGHFVGTIVQGHTPSVTDLTITSEGNATTVAEGATLQMYANVTPVDAYDRVIWSVWTDPDNPDRGEATIDPITGLLTGVSDGPVTVIAKALDGSLLDDTFSVNVTTP